MAVEKKKTDDGKLAKQEGQDQDQQRDLTVQATRNFSTLRTGDIYTVRPNDLGYVRAKALIEAGYLREVDRTMDPEASQDGDVEAEPGDDQDDIKGSGSTAGGSGVPAGGGKR